MISNKKTESFDLKQCNITMALNVKTKKDDLCKIQKSSFFLKNISYRKVFKISNLPSITASNFGGIYQVSPFFMG